MNSKVTNAVARLNEILPLAERLKTLSEEDTHVYQLILKSYVELGRSLTKDEMAQHVKDINATINTLRSNDMVVFNDNEEPVGAYPFTMEQREHKVTINNHTVHCMCALDALSVSPMFGQKTHIDSRCNETGATISIDQFNQTITNADENEGVHFGINWNSAANNCCATSLCTEMIFLRDQETADKWLAADPENREYFSLEEAMDFGARFFKPLLIE